MVDPGISRETSTAMMGCQPIMWPIFPQNCMKKKEIGPRGGSHPWCHLISANDKSVIPLYRLRHFLSLKSVYSNNEISSELEVNMRTHQASTLLNAI